MRPEIPADFIQGDPIDLRLELDRPMTALECRFINEGGLAKVWTAYPGDSDVSLRLTAGVDDRTFENLEKTRS